MALIRPHKKAKLIKVNNGFGFNANSYTKIEEIIEEDENYIIYTTCTLIDKKSTHGKNLLKKAYIQQNSPVKMILQQIDKYNHKDIRDDKPFEVFYELPEKIKEELNVNIKDIMDYYKE